MNRSSRATVADDAALGQGNVVAREPRRQDNSVVRQWLREAIDESGWKHEALASVMGLPDKFYLSKLLSGEKPLQVWHLTNLPDDIEVGFAKRWIESLGPMVIARLSEAEARQQFAAGFFSLMCGAFQSRAPMAKAGLK